MDQAALLKMEAMMYKEIKSLEIYVDQFDAIDQPNVGKEVLTYLSPSLV